MQYTGHNGDEIVRWSNGLVSKKRGFIGLEMMTKYGLGEAKPGTWVVRGSCGLFYPASNKEFQENYKLVEDKEELSEDSCHLFI